MMLSSSELPDCYYKTQPSLIKPITPTPNHYLYLTNLDDQKFLRFSIKYVYLFKTSVCIESLKVSLSKVLVEYYPLAGRLRTSRENDQKLEVDCNGEGAVFAEAFMDISADDFLRVCWRPSKSLRKLLYRVEAQDFLDIPPLVIQVTNLCCGGMIMCTAINHCLCDGIGTSQFLHAWAQKTSKPNFDVPIRPFHSRQVLKPRNPLQTPFTHNGYIRETSLPTDIDIKAYLHSQPLVPISITFSSSHILYLKRQCIPSIKCTTFEVLASHTWRCWVKSLELSPSQSVKLLFSFNIRKKLVPEIPHGYYGNGFVLGCAQTLVNDLVNYNLYSSVTLVQQAKSNITEESVRSLIDFLEDKSIKTDLSMSFVISQWSKLGLEELEFGHGKPLYMGPLTSDIYCIFLPVIDDFNAVRVLLSVPERVYDKFENYMKEGLNECEANGDAYDNGCHIVEDNQLINIHK